MKWKLVSLVLHSIPHLDQMKDNRLERARLDREMRTKAVSVPKDLETLVEQSKQ